jgi:hypothetical protein
MEDGRAFGDVRKERGDGAGRAHDGAHTLAQLDRTICWGAVRGRDAVPGRDWDAVLGRPGSA